MSDHDSRPEPFLVDGRVVPTDRVVEAIWTLCDEDPRLRPIRDTLVEDFADADKLDDPESGQRARVVKLLVEYFQGTTRHSVEDLELRELVGTTYVRAYATPPPEPRFDVCAERPGTRALDDAIEEFRAETAELKLRDQMGELADVPGVRVSRRER